MIDSPNALRQYSLSLASRMASEGFIKQSEILKHRATLPCTTGWEWLGELGLGVEKIRSQGKLPIYIEEKLGKIFMVTQSSTPYG